MKLLIAVAALTMFATACTVETEAARESGPHAEEFGLITSWLAGASTSTRDGCTDSTDWSGKVSEPDFEGTYLFYKVNDATSALGQTCETTSASSCSDADYSWSIAGNVLTLDDDPVTIEGDDKCDLVLQPVWKVVDNGETADFQVVMTFAADETKSDCAALEQSIKDASPNENGLLSCTITIDVDMAFQKVE